MQFADVKNDVAFRKIFGNENKKEILISFLNAVLKLEGNQKIDWVEILNPYQVPLVLGAESTVLGVKAKDVSGNEYIVEMQVTDRIGFAQRVAYYSAKSYSAQLNIGEEYFKPKPTIFIGILGFEFLENPNYLSRHLILDIETHEHKLKDLDFNFIELPKFNKKENELTTLIDKWVYFIKNANSLEVIPTHVDDEGLKSAYSVADKHLWTKKDIEAYEYAKMREADEIAREMFLRQKYELANEKAKQEALQEQEGERNAQIEIAKKSILAGVSNNLIAQIKRA